MTIELNRMMNNENNDSASKESLTRAQRLRRRGIPVLMGSIVLVGAGGAVALENISNSFSAEQCVPGDQKVTAGNGDSVWGLASELNQAQAVDLTVHQLAQANPEITQPGYVLHAGDTLSVPVCGSEK